MTSFPALSAYPSEAPESTKEVIVIYSAYLDICLSIWRKILHLIEKKKKALEKRCSILYLRFTESTLIASLLFMPLGLCGLGIALVLPVLIKLSRRCSIQDVEPEWLENFSPAVYYPMQGLLSAEDFRFLSRQPGFDLSLHRKLRRERLHIFRQYLTRLILDFNRLHVTARCLLAQSREDRSDLVTQLIWLKVRFSFAVIQAQMSYILCCVGFRTLAVRAMIAELEQMSAQLSFISATQAA